MHSQLDLLEELLACASPEEMKPAVSAYVQRMGFDCWAYAITAPPRRSVPYFITDITPAWVAHYQRSGYLEVDPVVAHCREHTTPIVWDAEGAIRRRLAPDLGLFRDALDFGLKSGVTVPVHGLGCDWGLVSVASSEPLQTAMPLKRLGEVQLLATFLHETGHRFALARGGPVNLTARELECLRWAAQGKTAWEISQVLGIAERTAIFHLENAARKLGVFGRRQAVARAIALQLLSP